MAVRQAEAVDGGDVREARRAGGTRQRSPLSRGRRRRGARGSRPWAPLRIRTLAGMRAGLVTAACAALCAACGGDGDGAHPAPTSTAATVAPADYGAYGTTTDDVYADTHTFSPARARLVGPHFVAQFDRVSFTTKLSHTQAMNFGYFANMDHDDMADMDGMGDMGGMDHSGHAKQMQGPSLQAPPGYRFMIVHTVPALPKSTPALPEYKNNIAPEDKVKGEIRAGGKTVKLPGIVRDLSSDHDILVSVPSGADPVLAITDAGRTQLLNLRTGRRQGDVISAYYPLKAADQIGVGVTGDFHGAAGKGAATVSVHGGKPALQPYADGPGWAEKGKAWLYLGGDIETQIGAASGSQRLDADLDAARSFRLTLPDGTTVRGVGKVSTRAPLPLGTAGQGAAEDRSGVAQGALSVAFEVPDSFRTGTVSFTPHGTYRYKGKRVDFTVRDAARALQLSLR